VGIEEKGLKEMTYEGHIENGVVVLENGATLPEGTRVRVETTEIRSSEGVTRKPLGKALQRFSGIAVGLPDDMAENHDHYLHVHHGGDVGARSSHR
jgi:hypothetical protein